MPDVSSIIERYTAALDAFSQSLARANDKSIDMNERLRRLKETDPYWEKLVEIQQEVDNLG